MDLMIAIIQILVLIVSMWAVGVLTQEWIESNKRGGK